MQYSSTEQQSYAATIGKLCEKYQPDENDGVLTYMIDDNVFQKHDCAYIGKKDCNELLSMQALGVNAIQIYMA